MIGVATGSFPESFAGLSRWATERGMPAGEARRRYAQLVVLAAIANSPSLGEMMVFKGGNALDFVLQPNRSTLDLDFTLDHPPGEPHVLAAEIERRIASGCRLIAGRMGMALVVQRVRQNPPGPNRTFVTFAVGIGYALPDQRAVIERARRGVRMAQTIDVDISINEPVCASIPLSLRPGLGTIRISTLEEIVSEKLRALLQQPIRRRERPQDLLDIAVALRGAQPPDPESVARFLLVKAAARDVPVSRAAFHAPEIARLTRAGYDDLGATTRILFIPFEQAMDALLRFVNALPIPDG